METSSAIPSSPRRLSGSGRPKVQSVDRTLDVLEALASRHAATGISELAGMVGLHVSTVHRLLATLVDRGYVRQDPESARYHLGSRVFALANAADVHLDLRLVARPFLERMMRGSGETANLATVSDGAMVYVDQVPSMHLVKMFAAAGLRAPLYSSGTGKVFLAFCGAEFAEPILAGAMHRFTARTIVKRAVLERELERVRGAGFALDDEEMEDGVRCVAVPVFDRRGVCIGAMSVSGPTTRMTDVHLEKVVPLARTIARELSEQLGFGAEVVPAASQ